LVDLVFHGGVGEIGGNKILLEDGDARVFIDFGKNFEKERLFFDQPYLAPREEKHLLSLGILPDIPGLYRKDPANPNVNAILLSHAHMDHTDYIRYVKSEVPVYCNETTLAMIMAREFSGKAPSDEYTIAKLTKTKGEQVVQNFNTLPTTKWTKIDSNVKVQPIEVDHSVLGACGFLIETSDGYIIYTGDFRMHGPRKKMSEDFIEKAKELKPKALIIEGTNIVGARVASEQEVLQKTNELISETTHLTMASFSTTDIERLLTFFASAKKHKKKLAISMKQAFLIHILKSKAKLNTIDLQDPDIYIFMREKKKYSEYENQIINNYLNVKQCEELSKIQEDLILVVSFFDMNEMCELKPKTGTKFILSHSEPHSEEMEIDHQKLLNWLEYYGIPLYHIHASGHAFPHQLKDAIAKIAPDKVFLIHTERPKLYERYLKDLGIDTQCPQHGKPYSL